MSSATERPRLLYLSHVLPAPPDSGARIRAHHTLRMLAGRFDVTALCFARSGEDAGTIAARVASLARFADVSAWQIPATRGGTRRVRDHVLSVLTRRPWVHFLYDAEDFATALQRLLHREPFDLVHVESLDLVRYLPRLPSRLPRVLAHHNIESALLERRAVAARGAARAYLRWQGRLLEREERTWAPRVSLNVTVSEPDRRRLLEIAPGALVTVLPNGVDTERYRPEPGPREGLVFVGGTDWFPNRDALEFLTGDVLPRFARTDRPRVHWVGRISDADRRRFAGTPGLVLTGHVPDERPYLQAAACCVVPLRLGGGTRLKILSAWASGTPVVSTSIGCEGLEARNGKNIMIADDAPGLAHSIARVLQDRGLQERLAQAGRQTAVREYDWDVIGGRLLDAYAPLLRAGGMRRT